MDFIFNHAYNSGGKWHLAAEPVKFETVPAETTERPDNRPGVGGTITHSPEHVIASATIHCGAASRRDWRNGTSTKSPIKTGGLDWNSREWQKAYRCHVKDPRLPIETTRRVVKPMVKCGVEDIDDIPEPLCGNCRPEVEKGLGPV